MFKLEDYLKDKIIDYRKNVENPPTKISLLSNNLTITDKNYLTILGAMPGIGKTTVILNAAIELARMGHVVNIFTYEMHGGILAERIISCATGIKSSDIEDYKLSGEEFTQSVLTMRDIKDNIYIGTPKTIEEAEQFIEQICQHPDHFSEFQETKVFIIWDYLQRLPFNVDLNTKDRIALNLREISAINLKYKTRSIVITSLNREGYYTTGLDSFKEAGDIESDMDMGIIMRLGKQRGGNWVPVGRDELVEARQANKVPVIFIIVKNRNGKEYEFVMEFDKERMQFNPIPVAEENKIGRRQTCIQIDNIN